MSGDWSSDVCSSDLPLLLEARRLKEERGSKTKACSMCGPFCPMNLVEAVLKGKGRMELPVA